MSSETTRAQQLQKIKELEDKIASGDYIKESDWRYVPDYGMVRSVIPDQEKLVLLKREVGDDSKWVLRSSIDNRK